MAAVVSQHPTILAAILDFQKIYFQQFKNAADFLEISRTHVLKPPNTNIIKNRVGKKLNKFCQKVAIFVFKL